MTGTYGKLLQVQKSKKTRRKKPAIKKEEEKEQKTVNQSVDQSTNQSTSQSIDPLADVDNLGAIVPRPRAFYITEKLDRMLDDAVKYLQDKGIHKADRSVLVNAMLHDPSLFKPKGLDKLRSRVLAHLTNKSLKRGS